MLSAIQKKLWPEGMQRPGGMRSGGRSTVPALLLALASLIAGGRALAQDQGIAALRQLDPTLTGSGITILQVEATPDQSVPYEFEVDPGSVNVPVSEFVYISGSGTATTFPNAVGVGSGHADGVADEMYGDNTTSNPEGIAYGISKIYNYEANYFVNSIVVPRTTAVPAEIVNESFVVLTDTATQALVEQDYDNYAAEYGTLFISGAGNGGLVSSPASAYNGIAVGAYEGSSSSGNYDGRSKPDIVAFVPSPGNFTSFTTPLVSGAAAILLQAAQRGDAGTSTKAKMDGADARVLKALLLNGATKPAGWKSTVANPSTTPLDPVTGAGLLNVFNSYENLAAGEHSFSMSLAGAVRGATGSTFDPAEGWDLNTVTNVFSGGSYVNEANHYLFNLSASAGPDFTLTSTLIWWRQLGQTAINNLDLYLFDTDTGQTIATSVSTIDNVEEIYVQNLAPGHYDLAVLKNGSAPIGSGGTVVSAAETYAVAFNFAAVPEPSALWLLAPGLAGLIAVRKLRRGKMGVL